MRDVVTDIVSFKQTQYKSQQVARDRHPSRKIFPVILFQNRFNIIPDQNPKHIGHLTIFPNNGCTMPTFSRTGLKIAAVVTAIVIPKLTKIQINMIRVGGYS